MGLILFLISFLFFLEVCMYGKQYKSFSYTIYKRITQCIKYHWEHIDKYITIKRK